MKRSTESERLNGNAFVQSKKGVTVFLGLGSNIGDRKRNILKAVEEFERNGQKILKISSIYETKPWGFEKQRKFLNAAVKMKTFLTASDLLALCKYIENKIGRKKSFRWGPRKVDLDILFYGKKKVNTEKLKIPHPEIKNREFVLNPLKEIAPDLIHPVYGQSISNMLKKHLKI